MVKGSAYMGHEEKSYLIIGEANPEMEGDTGEMEIQFKRSMRQHDRRETQHFEVAETEPFDTTIHDQPAHFTLSRVVDKKADEEQWRAEGSFQGLGGPAILLFEGRAPDFDKEQVLDMLKSMK